MKAMSRVWRLIGRMGVDPGGREGGTLSSGFPIGPRRGPGKDSVLKAVPANTSSGRCAGGFAVVAGGRNVRSWGHAGDR